MGTSGGGVIKGFRGDVQDIQRNIGQRNIGQRHIGRFTTVHTTMALSNTKVKPTSCDPVHLGNRCKHILLNSFDVGMGRWVDGMERVVFVHVLKRWRVR